MQKGTRISQQDPPSPSQLINARIRELTDWRDETLAKIRALIRQALPDVVEEWNGAVFRCGSRPGSSAPARPTGAW